MGSLKIFYMGNLYPNYFLVTDFFLIVDWII